METIKAAMASTSRHKAVSLAALALILAFVALSAARCTAVHAPVDAETAPQEQQSDGDQGPALDERQEALIASYGQEESELKAILEANVWTGAGGNSTLMFSDNSYTESSTDGTQRSAAYAIEAMQKSPSGDGKTETTTAAILVDGSTHIITLLKIEDRKDGSLSMTLSGDCFSFSGAYTRTDAAASLDVDEMDDGFSELVDGKDDEVREAVEDWAAQYCPTATKAEWSGIATADWTGGTVSTSFSFNNQAKSQVTITYSMKDGTVTAGDIR